MNQKRKVQAVNISLVGKASRYFNKSFPPSTNQYKKSQKIILVAELVIINKSISCLIDQIGCSTWFLIYIWFGMNI